MGDATGTYVCGIGCEIRGPSRPPLRTLLLVLLAASEPGAPASPAAAAAAASSAPSSTASATSALRRRFVAGPPAWVR